MTKPSAAENFETVLKDKANKAAGGSLPPQLQRLTDQHVERLRSLVEAMRVAGVDDGLVRLSVRDIIDSYEAELLDALLRLAEERS